MPSNTPPPLVVLTRLKVSKKVGKAKSTILSWEDRKSKHYNPDWPKPFPLSPRSIGYFEHEIDEWLLRMAATRDA